MVDANASHGYRTRMYFVCLFSFLIKWVALSKLTSQTSNVASNLPNQSILELIAHTPMVNRLRIELLIPNIFTIINPYIFTDCLFLSDLQKVMSILVCKRYVPLNCIPIPASLHHCQIFCISSKNPQLRSTRFTVSAAAATLPMPELGSLTLTSRHQHTPLVQTLSPNQKNQISLYISTLLEWNQVEWMIYWFLGAKDHSDYVQYTDVFFGIGDVENESNSCEGGGWGNVKTHWRFSCYSSSHLLLLQQRRQQSYHESWFFYLCWET